MLFDVGALTDFGGNIAPPQADSAVFFRRAVVFLDFPQMPRALVLSILGNVNCTDVTSEPRIQVSLLRIMVAFQEYPQMPSLVLMLLGSVIRTMLILKAGTAGTLMML